MRLLVLAPQPFFQERGTPIAVKLLLQVLARRRGPDGTAPEIDLLTYQEGQKIEIPSVKIRRSWIPPGFGAIAPGISLRKLAADFFFGWSFARLLWQQRKQPYTLIHAVEESVFFALVAKLVLRIPYVYDMDSSLSLQLTDAWRWLRPLQRCGEFLERIAAQQSLAVVAVCDALVESAKKYGAPAVYLLPDVSLLDDQRESACTAKAGEQDLRKAIGAGPQQLLALYVGNLETYQGIDLLLEGYARVATVLPTLSVVLLGGTTTQIEQYRQKCSRLGIEAQAHFLGPRPVQELSAYIAQADILLSPRTKGNNTPMKIYSYLHSGKAILATKLFTHTQVLTPKVAELCQPTPEGVAQALQVLAHNQQRRSELGKAGQALAQEKYTLQSFSRTLNQIYDQLGGSLACSTNHSVTHNAPHTEGQLTAVLHKAGSATNGSPELRVEQK